MCDALVDSPSDLQLAEMKCKEMRRKAILYVLFFSDIS